MYCLAVDSGNSFLKWAFFKNGRKLALNTVCNRELHQLDTDWRSLRQPDTIIVSHVSGHDIQIQLAQLFKIWNIQPYWIEPLPKQCGVINNYTDPKQLGSDRWAALIASWNKFHESCLVVNVGTAQTIDVLSRDGVFLGGIIVPGPYTLKNSIQFATQINLKNDNYCYQNFPTNTTDAIYSGIIDALVGSIERTMRLFQQYQGYSIKHCLISGGGHAELLPHLEFKYTVIENLVLDGMLLIAQDTERT
ncbi:type III pantothenate kinase [Nitrosomonas marina]|uniref:Type III pantothenate kinase n=1 Tax=Nitrosomonas marina TaxID=917 RepID=A0A1I0EXD1_9PROT|nr:type III pantothenate kinase [Nitrosomonas marina]SET50179.1 type III pantothenate kinase [Nitrosomonas marina]